MEKATAFLEKKGIFKMESFKITISKDLLTDLLTEFHEKQLSKISNEDIIKVKKMAHETRRLKNELDALNIANVTLKLNKLSEGINETKAFMQPPKDQIKTILIDNCQDCPFCNNDNEYGHDGCNLDANIGADIIDYQLEMPSKSTHAKCPVKNMNYRIRLK